MNRFSKIALALAFAAVFVSTALAQIIPPQGRLTLVSGQPVMSAEMNGATVLYYTPYVGNGLPISNGTSLSNGTFSQLSLSFAGATANQLDDVYAYYVSGAFVLCYTDWGTVGSTSRPTSPQDYSQTRLQGIWVNTSALSGGACQSDSTNYSVPAKQGIYLGTFYSSSVPGASTVGVTFNVKPTPATYGSNNLIGLWNAYNRVRLLSVEEDNNPTNYVYSGGLRPMDPAGTNDYRNRVTYVDGLGLTAVTARLATWLSGNAAGYQANIGINYDSTTAGPDLKSYYIATSSNNYETLAVVDSFPPALGLNYVQAMEEVNSGSMTFSPASHVMGLILDTEY